jgi:hypothetical protein
VRQTVRAVQVLAVIGAIVAAVGPLGSILGALGVGWAMSALVNLVVGTPKATPTLKQVVNALDDLGVDISDLELADDQTWGETRFVGRDADRRDASVIVIGRDATDARLFHKLWRALMYRDAGPSPAVGRSAQLEHRAYLLLLASRVGVSVSEVVIAAAGGWRTPRFSSCWSRSAVASPSSRATRSATACSTTSGPTWPACTTLD